MRKKMKKIASLIIAIVLVITVMPLSMMTVYAETATSDTTATVGSYTIKVPKGAEIPDSSTTVTEITSAFLETKYVESDHEYKLDEGWYVVDNDASNNPLNVSHQITFNGDANIILKDGSKITVEGNGGDSNKYGIRVTSSYNLTIWSGVEGTGQLVAKGGANQDWSYGISVVNGNLIQNGGIITAIGESATSDNSVGIDIGGDYLTQNGGKIIAKGGASVSDGSYGIYVDSADLIQKNGKITATSNNSYNESCGIYVDYGNLRQYKGEITANSAVSSNDSSFGIYVEDGDLIQYDGKIEATANKATEGTSCGIYIGDENFEQHKGTIIARGDEGQSSGGIYVDNDLTHNNGQIEAYGAESTETWGIYVANCFIQSGGSVKAIGGDAPSNSVDTFSYGVYVDEDLTMIGGDVLASGGTAESSYGIQVDDGFCISGSASSLSADGESKAIYCVNTLIVSDGFTVKAGTASPGSVVTKSGTESWIDKLCPSSDAPKYVSISPSTPTSYTITKASTTNGSFTVSANSAVKDTEITITPTANSGYEVDTVYVKDSDNNTVTVSNNKFTMPGKNVTVKVTFKVSTPSSGQVEIPAAKQTGNFASGGLKNSSDEVKSKVLSDEDKTAIEAGKDVNVWLEIKDQSSTVSTTDKTAVEKKLPNDYKVGLYLDVNLWKQVEGSAATKVTQTPNGKVKIGFTIPKELQKAGRTYKLIRIHNGVATVLDTTVDSNYGLTAETDQFSTYALIYDETDASEATTKSPKTGDTNTMWLWMLMMMAGFGMVGVATYYKKKNR